jgi:hypothetical protein
MLSLRLFFYCDPIGQLMWWWMVTTVIRDTGALGIKVDLHG